ncbi:MAG: SDR family oxidoreductase [Bacteroidales bacterium]|nr:SDR family oxidoreductase [Bacteroidales bacterium]
MMAGILEGKKGIIFGALNDKSIAWKAAEAAVREGASIVLTNTAMALRFGTMDELAQKCSAPVVVADATSIEDLEKLVDETIAHFGGKFDFVLHSVGMSPNIRKNIPYETLNYDFLSKTLDISAVSFHKLLKVLYAKDALNDNGSVVALSYIAADRAVGGYSDMADAKALLQSITRNFGTIYGRRNGVRVNTVSQSPTMTSAGQGIAGMDKMFDYADRLSPLGNASAEDCADYLVTLFSDYTRKITMQNLYSDGGFSSMVITQEMF